MKKFLLSAIWLLLAICIAGQNKFDTRSQIDINRLLWTCQEESCRIQHHRVAHQLNDAVDILVIIKPETTSFDIEKYGVRVHEILGDVAICSGNLSDVITLSESNIIRQISLSRRLEPLNDLSRTLTGVASIWDSAMFDNGIDGKGVCVGIFDIGIDANHPNFKDDLGDSRISHLWHLNGDGGYTHYTTENIEDFTCDTPYQTHGTHTMGSLAGSYNGPGICALSSEVGSSTITQNRIPFSGMAPAAKIIAACGNPTSANIILGFSKICEAITDSGMPGVISFSFGSNLGPHDGTDAETRALNEIAKDIPFFIAAGNEASEGISLVGDIYNESDEIKSILLMDGDVAKGDIQIWSRDSCAFDLSVAVVNRTTKKIAALMDIPSSKSSVLIRTSDVATVDCITHQVLDKAFVGSEIAVASGVDAVNSRWNMTLNYSLSLSTVNFAKSYQIGLIIRGKPGQHFDLVHSTSTLTGQTARLSSCSLPNWSDGSGEMSISNTACGPDMICIGAWNARSCWPTLGGEIKRYADDIFANDRVGGYSSYGLLADGRTLPVACAPGTGIISSVSRYWVDACSDVSEMVASSLNGSSDAYWGVMQGTSMATPIAAGIAALWLQVNPLLDSHDIREIIESSVDIDETVTDGPFSPVAWGAGKINAFKGLLKAMDKSNRSQEIMEDDKFTVICHNGVIHISDLGSSHTSVEIYNVDGCRVLVSKGDGPSLSIPHTLSKGVYLVKVNSHYAKRIIIY